MVEGTGIWVRGHLWLMIWGGGELFTSSSDNERDLIEENDKPNSKNFRKSTII
jgi:hypothetical protein